MSASDQSGMPFLDAICEYSARERQQFCMPGHKAGRGAPLELVQALGHALFRHDVTEVAESDVLSDPQGVLRRAQELAAEAFGVHRSFFLVNGASVGILAAMCSVLGEKDRVLVHRACHRSVVGGLVMTGAMPTYFDHGPVPAFAIGGVSLDELGKRLAAIRPRAVVLSSPSYFGLVPNLSEISRVCRRQGVVLIVDEAHGAHFCFHGALPRTATRCGADLVVHSAHKTIGALYQTGLLHVASDRVDPEWVQRHLAFLQSTSPSVPLLMSIDAARSNMACNGLGLIQGALGSAARLSESVRKLDHVEVVAPGPEELRVWGHFERDKTKVVLRVDPGIASARAAKRELARRWGCEAEMADEQYLLLTFTVADGGRGEAQVSTLVRALGELCAAYVEENRGKGGAGKGEAVDLSMATSPPVVETSPRDAVFARGTSVPLAEAVGRIVQDVVCAYPPGVPICVPGERITESVRHNVAKLQGQGARLTGLLHAPGQEGWVRVVS